MRGVVQKGPVAGRETVADNPEGTDVVSDETLKGVATSENGDGVCTKSEPQTGGEAGYRTLDKDTKGKPTTSESSRFSGNERLCKGKTAGRECQTSGGGNQGEVASGQES